VRAIIPGCILFSAACRGQLTLVKWLLEPKSVDITYDHIPDREYSLGHAGVLSSGARRS
jgi:hypothetical protein